ncbi:nucleotidyltransferase [Yangia mangrovi]|uniref:Cyclic GMP-AMP synthase n=1 Tax=Alloyangia mangrovi TaxID=1779329 RepID=A0A2A3K0R6_9RHOB|nr:nucleotidyltransferase [Alloyangia mangrovi]MCT4372025.1 nucleotidyltransferase [Alloyangia mangrovi]
MSVAITKQAEAYLEALAEALEIPLARYEQAETSYKSLGDWLHREASSVRDHDPDIFIQGSFRLGTVIRPMSDDEEYDVDCACSLTSLSKSDLSQYDLKDMLGKEIKLYRESKGIKKPVHEGRRCWRLEYADGAQFHMDIVPCIPNAEDQRLLLETRNLDAQFSDTAIAITDNEEPAYYAITDEWPRSNPRGYAEWFKSRMGDVFLRRRQKILNEMRAEGVAASVEDIPTYRVRTPLQSTIMILKRHRDSMFADDPTDKPISIIISSLAAHAYQSEETIGYALLSILSRMEDAIEHDGTKYIIKNPTDALENFADKWEDHPERADAFFEWLKQAREDFSTAGRLVEHRRMANVLASRMGQGLTDRASNRVLQPSRPGSPSLVKAAGVASATSAPSVSFGDTPRTPKKPDGFA